MSKFTKFVSAVGLALIYSYLTNEKNLPDNETFFANASVADNYEDDQLIIRTIRNLVETKTPTSTTSSPTGISSSTAASVADPTKTKTTSPQSTPTTSSLTSSSSKSKSTSKTKPSSPPKPAAVVPPKCIIHKDKHGKKTQKCQQFEKVYYEKRVVIPYPNGFVEEFYDGEHCYSSIFMIPGSQLMSGTVMGIVYFIWLLYLFLGISIIADIFMESIEVITSSTKDIEVQDKDGNLMTYQVPVWNATVANLTLMALGSSAPEILLSIIEALKTLGGKAGELGPSSIVGSGAFNLLIISGISILSVEEPKRIYDLGVYSCTAFFSLFAYTWMYICLELWTPGIVDVTEAWLTLAFFFVLVGMSFGFDKWQQHKDKVSQTREEADEKLKEEVLNIKKSHLRMQAKKFGEQTIVSIARGNGDDKAKMLNQDAQNEIIRIYKVVLGVESLSEVSANQLLEVLKPDSLLERFAAKKANKVGSNKDFLQIKGLKGQIENNTNISKQDQNEIVGFKCLHYSVTEASGHVELTAVKKQKNAKIRFGVRTVNDTARPDTDYKPIDTVVTMNENTYEQIIKVPLIDNDDWEPDLDFLVELYEVDHPSAKRLKGGDTMTRVTILDEDTPGSFGFEKTDIRVNKSSDFVDIMIKRIDGSSGKVILDVKTTPIMEGHDEANFPNARENKDYLHLEEKITFTHGEVEKSVRVSLLDNQSHLVAVKGKGSFEESEDADQEELEDKMFKVILYDSKKLEGVKISKKNACIITLVYNDEEDKHVLAEQKLIEYFVANKDPSWGQQFKNACMLGPQIDEDGLTVVEVSGVEAAFHFLLIGWKLLFAIVPPVKWGGGIPAFFIALTMTGIITAIVGEIAELLGCVLSLDPQITAITIVAIGTSLPDTFASVTAAQNSEYADSAIGNVTGSNSVNVFLGLGLPWVMSAMYGQSINKPYEVPPGKLGFSVMMFLMTSLACFAILTLRRIAIGGELGGPKTSRYITAGMCFFLWGFYALMSILNVSGAFGPLETKK